MIVLDANLLIGYIDSHDEHHAETLALLEEGVERGMATSSLTLAEALVYPTRQGTQRASYESIIRIGIDVVPLEASDSLDIARVRLKSRLKMPDAVVLHLAQSRRAAIATFDATLAREARASGLEVVGA